MKSIGIIAEYNPFTNGHLHHLKEIKNKYPNYISYEFSFYSKRRTNYNW